MDSIQLLLQEVLVLILLVIALFELYYLDVYHLLYLVHHDEMEIHIIVILVYFKVLVIQDVVYIKLKQYVMRMQEVVVVG